MPAKERIDHGGRGDLIINTSCSPRRKEHNQSMAKKRLELFLAIKHVI